MNLPPLLGQPARAPSGHVLFPAKSAATEGVGTTGDLLRPGDHTVADVATPAPDAPSCFGGYRLLRRLGSGGMAEVFLAQSLADSRAPPVALKRLLPHLANSREHEHLLRGEVLLGARIAHPAIPTVFNMGVAEGVAYFTMEYRAGRNLAEVLRASRRRAKIPLSFALGVAEQAAEALHAAHVTSDARGELLRIVHCDVSPANLLLSFSGHVSLLDFGVARSTAGEAARTSGTLQGKVPYMSPEQCRCDMLDARSDIFSLGVVLYELLTQRRLFRCREKGTLVRAIGSLASPPLAIDHSALPPRLTDILRRALQPNRALRYPTARDLACDLRAAMALDTSCRDAKARGAWAVRLFPETDDQPGPPGDLTSPSPEGRPRDESGGDGEPQTSRWVVPEELRRAARMDSDEEDAASTLPTSPRFAIYYEREFGGAEPSVVNQATLVGHERPVHHRPSDSPLPPR